MYEFERIAGSRYQARLKAVRRSEEMNFCAIPFAKFVRDRQCGNDMPTRASADDQNPQRNQSVSRVMFSNTPIESNVM